MMKPVPGPQRQDTEQIILQAALTVSLTSQSTLDKDLGFVAE